jgi:beta-galactosidase/beta-glucuronidase
VRNRIISEEEVTLNVAAKFDIQCFKDEKLSEGYTMQVTHNDNNLGSVPVTEEAAYINIKIANPKFWWPNGIGEPYIYDLCITLYKDG